MNDYHPKDRTQQEYLIRFETTALHSLPAVISFSLKGCILSDLIPFRLQQFYPECAQLNITGGGSLPTAAELITFPGYSNSDPGCVIYTLTVTVDIYPVALRL